MDSRFRGNDVSLVIRDWTSGDGFRRRFRCMAASQAAQALRCSDSRFPIPDLSIFDLTPTLDCNGRPLALDRVRVMGIVKVTPDSFSDGGEHATPDSAIAHALQLAEEGADILDIGGESTRPGAAELGVQEELDRVIPVIERLATQTRLPISIETSKPEVMQAAVAAGAGLINDEYALRRDGALETAAALGVPVVLMHMQGEPRSMQEAPHYDDVVAQVHRFLAERTLRRRNGRHRQEAHHRRSRLWLRQEPRAQSRDARATGTLRRNGRATACGTVAQTHDRRAHWPRGSTPAGLRLRGRASHRRPAWREDRACARRSRHRGCLEGMERGGRAADAEARSSTPTVRWSDDE